LTVVPIQRHHGPKYAFLALFPLRVILQGAVDSSSKGVTLDAEHVVHESEHHDPALGTPQTIHAGPANEVLAMQVQAFLEASEDVDVDAETIEDILAVLVGTEHDADLESEVPVEESQMATDESDDDDEEPPFLFPAGAESNGETQCMYTIFLSIYPRG
jgi:hypothetical protein